MCVARASSGPRGPGWLVSSARGDRVCSVGRRVCGCCFCRPLLLRRQSCSAWFIRQRCGRAVRLLLWSVGLVLSSVSSAAAASSVVIGVFHRSAARSVGGSGAVVSVIYRFCVVSSGLRVRSVGVTAGRLDGSSCRVLSLLLGRGSVGRGVVGSLVCVFRAVARGLLVGWVLARLRRSRVVAAFVRSARWWVVCIRQGGWSAVESRRAALRSADCVIGVGRSVGWLMFGRCFVRALLGWAGALGRSSVGLSGGSAWLLRRSQGWLLSGCSCVCPSLGWAGALGRSSVGRSGGLAWWLRRSQGGGRHRRGDCRGCRRRGGRVIERDVARVRCARMGSGDRRGGGAARCRTRAAACAV